MKGYIISLVGATLLSSLVCGLFSGEEGKWVRFAAGLAVACVVLSPMLRAWEIPVSDFAVQELEIKSTDYLMDAFEKKLSEEISAYILEQTGENVAAVVVSETDETGAITGVSEVRLSPCTAQTARCAAELLNIDISRVVEEE